MIRASEGYPAHLLGSILLSILGCSCGISVAPDTGAAGRGGSRPAADGSAGQASSPARTPGAGSDVRSTTDRSSGGAGKPETAAAGPAAAPASRAGAPAVEAAGAPADAADAGTAGPDDETQWIIDNGFGSFHFAVQCVSVGDDGSREEGEPLPVGGGYQLECETASSIGAATTEFLNASDERYCVLGSLSEALGESKHPCLTHVEITSSPDDGPWTLVASGDQPCQISRAASAFGKTWPLWVNASYDTEKISPAVDGSTCDELFDL